MAKNKQLTEKERAEQQAEQLPDRKAMSVLGLGDELDIDTDVALIDDGNEGSSGDSDEDGSFRSSEESGGSDGLIIDADVRSTDS